MTDRTVAEVMAAHALHKYGNTSQAHAYLLGMWDALFNLDREANATQRNVILCAAELVRQNSTENGTFLTLEPTDE